MATRTIGIIVEGATGRLGSTQHLRSLMAIRNEGGLALGNGDRLVPDPVLLGRDPAKLAPLAAGNGGLKWSTDRDTSLTDRNTKAPALGVGARLTREALARGLVLRVRPGGANPPVGDTICLAPPLMTPPEVLDRIPQILRAAISAAIPS